MGDNYGPMVVTRQPMSIEQARKATIAIPGRLTSAYLALQLCMGKDQPVTVMPFDEILPAVKEGRVEAGLLIHEGQLTYGKEGLHCVVNLGEWWFEKTKGLPLPLGGNVIRRDLGQEAMDEVARLLKASIVHALEHRQDALGHAMSYARGLDPNDADQFVGMYVNDLTVDYGERGRQAVQLFLDEAHAAGLIPGKVDVQFVG
jgi:1,4-dihydroxy-6-naphthoate synthase